MVQTPQGPLEMTGNFWQHEYEIRQQGQLVASISKKWFSWSDTYTVQIQNQSGQRNSWQW
ncbi:hypothetical protein [Alishewanella tabrizica]|uniref:Uncharacterized protein n=1 Tax=Alishewanella tabrizica TaxID=671278 RepID=A0ABQ2WSU6_9ALTE|nr:hypothetical protein [Alishewanella tabrizica]GGW72048.1 hypothetical protein GCM10008111_30290 [Alishewanella tabrizica]